MGSVPRAKPLITGCSCGLDSGETSDMLLSCNAANAVGVVRGAG